MGTLHVSNAVGDEFSHGGDKEEHRADKEEWRSPGVVVLRQKKEGAENEEARPYYVAQGHDALRRKAQCRQHAGASFRRGARQVVDGREEEYERPDDKEPDPGDGLAILDLILH